MARPLYILLWFRPPKRWSGDKCLLLVMGVHWKFRLLIIDNPILNFGCKVNQSPSAVYSRCLAISTNMKQLLVSLTPKYGVINNRHSKFLVDFHYNKEVASLQSIFGRAVSEQNGGLAMILYTMIWWSKFCMPHFFQSLQLLKNCKGTCWHMHTLTCKCAYMCTHD